MLTITLDGRAGLLCELCERDSCECRDADPTRGVGVTRGVASSTMGSKSGPTFKGSNFSTNAADRLLGVLEDFATRVLLDYKNTHTTWLTHALW